MPTRPYTESRKNCNKKWDENNLERVSLAMPKGEKEKIKNAADSAGMSMNSFILTAVREKINGTSENA